MSQSPLVSVVIPVHNGRELLPQVLRALAASDLPRSQWECIVVDDASADDSAMLAASLADTLVRLPGAPRGPAYARNRGVEVARGDYIVFIDADVAVHEDTISRLLQELVENRDVAAVFGSFDDRPPAPGLVSQYWNLLQAYGPQAHGGDAWTFAAGCGAVRRSALTAVGGFDEWHFQAPLIEDLELGARLRANGERVLLCPSIRVTHLKRWTVRTMFRDVWNRGVMVGRLLGYWQSLRRARSDVLHTLTSATSILACVCAVAVLTAARSVYPSWIALGLSLLMAGALNFSVHWYLMQRRGLVFSFTVAPLHLAAEVVSGAALTYGWLLRHVIGEPSPDPTTQAFAEVGLETWPPVPRRR